MRSPFFFFLHSQTQTQHVPLPPACAGATLDSLATTYANEIYEGDDFDVEDVVEAKEEKEE